MKFPARIVCVEASPLSAPAPARPTPAYRPRGKTDLQRLFHERFHAFEAAYEGKYADEYGRHRLPLIVKAAAAFDACGDWENGIARIRCAHCGFDYFRPFSCKSFFLCPSCGQKRTLLLGEYLADDLLLRLPHRQFVANEVRDGQYRRLCVGFSSVTACCSPKSGS